MKKLLFGSLLIILAVNQYGQVARISIAPTWSNTFYYRFVAGSYSTDSKIGVDASLEYIKSQDARFTIGFGIDFQHSNLVIIPAPTGDPIVTHQESINVLSANFKTIYNLGKGFFLTANSLIDLQLPSKSQSAVDKQTGLGLSLSAGNRIIITNRVGLSIEPIIWIHNIVPFTKLNLPGRLTVIGIKAGLSLNK